MLYVCVSVRMWLCLCVVCCVCECKYDAQAAVGVLACRYRKACLNRVTHMCAYGHACSVVMQLRTRQVVSIFSCVPAVETPKLRCVRAMFCASQRFKHKSENGFLFLHSEISCPAEPATESGLGPSQVCYDLFVVFFCFCDIMSGLRRSPGCV